jgi:hypothetical protein
LLSESQEQDEHDSLSVAKIAGWVAPRGVLNANKGMDTLMAETFNVEDLDMIFIVVPRDFESGTVNLPVSEMSSKQFRDWISAKCEIEGISMIVPEGEIRLETRVNMLNRLSENGVKIYKLGG